MDVENICRARSQGRKNLHAGEKVFHETGSRGNDSQFACDLRRQSTAEYVEMILIAIYAMYVGL